MLFTAIRITLSNTHSPHPTRFSHLYRYGVHAGWWTVYQISRCFFLAFGDCQAAWRSAFAWKGWLLHSLFRPVLYTFFVRYILVGCIFVLTFRLTWILYLTLPLNCLQGAYRVALWAFIVEIIFHAGEVWRGTMTWDDTVGMFCACAVMIIWMTLQYKANLYPNKSKDTWKRWDLTVRSASAMNYVSVVLLSCLSHNKLFF